MARKSKSVKKTEATFRLAGTIARLAGDIQTAANLMDNDTDPVSIVRQGNDLSVANTIESIRDQLDLYERMVRLIEAE